ncbi:MAG: branched-chain amino acid ABC transporter permease, partial [Oleispira sp.]|nr:branched-chain amino acid ABC transporter permease [Oleispira sp.]
MQMLVRKSLFLMVVVVIALAVPFATNGYSQYVINLILVYVAIGIGFNILLGYAGQFAFASAAFMGIGAYTTAILSSTVGVPFWLCIPLAGVVTTIVGVACAVPALRVVSIYLALVTFAFAELMVWVFLNWKSLTHGANGIGVASPELMGYPLGGDTNIYYLLLPCVAMSFWASVRIIRSAVGRSFVMVRESEIVAKCNGINVAGTKMVAFGLSAFFGGLGGAFFAYVVGFILPSSFGLSQLVIHIAVVVIGGMGSLVGPVIGAVILTVVPEVLRDFQSLQEILFGATLILVPIFVPKGGAGLLVKVGLL